MQETISAIILSAGTSRRMGTPKALLRLGNKTFLQHILDTVESAGIKNNIIVLGFEPQPIQETLTSFRGTVVINEQWEQGQLSSILAGINVLNQSDCKGALICLVDHPLISILLIQQLFKAFQHSPGKIVIPTFNGRKGHPIIIPSQLFHEIKNASLNVGLREVVRAHEKDIALVPTEEEGIIINIDTPDDYQKYIKDSLVQ